MLRNATPDLYPAVKPEDLAAFKIAVAHAASGIEQIKWILIGALPMAFLLLTDNILHIADWGAIFWFGALACSFIAQAVGANANRDAQQKARSLGRGLRLFRQ